MCASNVIFFFIYHITNVIFDAPSIIRSNFHAEKEGNILIKIAIYTVFYLRVLQATAGPEE